MDSFPFREWPGAPTVSLHVYRASIELRRGQTIVLARTLFQLDMEPGPIWQHLFRPLTRRSAPIAVCIVREPADCTGKLWIRLWERGWNTRKVPNGSYTLKLTVEDTVGRSASKTLWLGSRTDSDVVRDDDVDRLCRAVPDDVPGGHGQPEGAVAEGRGVPVGALPAGAGEEGTRARRALLAQAERGVGAEVLPRARRIVVGDGDLIAFRAVGAGPHAGREDVAVDDSLPVSGPVDGEVDASRMMVRLEEGDVAPPASEGLEVLNPGADIDQAREPARVEAGAAGREDGRPMRSAKPSPPAGGNGSPG